MESCFGEIPARIPSLLRGVVPGILFPMVGRGRWLAAALLVWAAPPSDAQNLLPDRPAPEGVDPAVPVPPPPVDLIAPVPAPEIPLGAPDSFGGELPENVKIENFGGGPIRFHPQEGVRYDGPGVRFTGDNGLEVFADSAVLDLRAETVTLRGNVSIYRGNILQRGDLAVYHYERRFLDTRGLRASIDPFLLEAGKFTAEEIGGRTVFIGRDAGVTTHDVENPNFWVHADQTTIFPGEKVVFRNLTLRAGDTPVFWLPYLSQPLDSALGYHFVPGARSNWGPFLLNTYGIMLGGEVDPVTGENKDAWLLSRWHMDIRARRGVGLGVDLSDIRTEDREFFSGLGLYYLNDLDPSLSRTGVSRGFVNEDRYRIGWKDRRRFDFPDGADWRLDSNLTWLSDQYYLQDFDTRLYRVDPQPDNTIGLFRRDEASLLSLFTRLRVNEFYRADTRLPEVAFDQARAPRFGLPVLHEGRSSFAVIHEQAADPLRDAVLDPLSRMTLDDPGATRLLRQLTGYERQLARRMVGLPLDDPRREELRTQLIDSGYHRFDTYQELSLPLNPGGFLSLTPVAGAGYSHYGSVDGPADDFGRTYVHVGAEAAVKFSKDLGPTRHPEWGLDGLLHVIQPYGGWSLVSSDDFELGDPAVDRLTPTTRPRPIQPLHFTAVDQMNTWNILRFGARNRLITRRDGQSFEWLYLDTYMDTFLENPEDSRNFSNLYNDIRWSPLPWLSVELETQFPILDGGSGFNEYHSRFRFMPGDSFEFGVRYRFLDGHPTLVDSSRFDLMTYTRLNENWGVGTRHAIEFDDSTLEIQNYTLHRDLGNWVAGVGFSVRDNRRDKEYGMVLSLTLKDFPSVALPLKLDVE